MKTVINQLKYVETESENVWNTVESFLAFCRRCSLTKADQNHEQKHQQIVTKSDNSATVCLFLRSSRHESTAGENIEQIKHQLNCCHFQALCLSIFHWPGSSTAQHLVVASHSPASRAGFARPHREKGHAPDPNKARPCEAMRGQGHNQSATLQVQISAMFIAKCIAGLAHQHHTCHNLFPLTGTQPLPGDSRMSCSTQVVMYRHGKGSCDDGEMLNMQSRYRETIFETTIWDNILYKTCSARYRSHGQMHANTHLNKCLTIFKPIMSLHILISKIIKIYPRLSSDKVKRLAVSSTSKLPTATLALM